MVSFRAIFIAVLALTILSGAAATYLAGTSGPAGRHRVAERLAYIAMVGAGALMMLLNDGAE
ncbi:MAG: hypothetical protein K5872_06550 [Rhizobiaceae bacterium]|nr:hypothetical protein [Rhizobiaceae bacterium]MCV0405873.1 hypothetical protein [Rhizobiaceae bacterium]